MAELTAASEDVLLRGALGLLDGASVERIIALRRHKLPTPTTSFAASDVYELLDAIEHVQPGLLDRYLEIRADS